VNAEHNQAHITIGEARGWRCAQDPVSRLARTHAEVRNFAQDLEVLTHPLGDDELSTEDVYAVLEAAVEGTSVDTTSFNPAGLPLASHSRRLRGKHA
jgi:hypothetical protein